MSLRACKTCKTEIGLKSNRSKFPSAAEMAEHGTCVDILIIKYGPSLNEGFVKLIDYGSFVFISSEPTRICSGRLEAICVLDKDLIDFQNFVGLFKFSVTDFR